MPTPQIGRVRYVLPRAVNVRQGDAMTDTHSAVHGTVAVYTDTLTETQAILANWEEVIHAIGEKINEIILREQNVE